MQKSLSRQEDDSLPKRKKYIKFLKPFQWIQRWWETYPRIRRIGSFQDAWKQFVFSVFPDVRPGIFDSKG